MARPSQMASSPLQPTTTLDLSPFKPSIVVIVSILTAIFLITFFLLVYAKHCKGVGLNGGGVHAHRGSMTVRKNSGIDMSVIETLPLFRFGSLRGDKDGLECAVCLNVFEPTEVLKLLPKCKHAFHVECIDKWLNAHSTCPLCRYQVNPEDILIIEEPKILHENKSVPHDESNSVHLEIESEMVTKSTTTTTTATKRVMGRHSSAGEGTTHHNRVGLFTTSLRQSFDNRKKKGKNNIDQHVVDLGCFDDQRSDGLLLTNTSRKKESGLSSMMGARSISSAQSYRTCSGRRLEHQIIVDICGTKDSTRNYAQPSTDLLYLRTEMILCDNRRTLSFNQPSRRALNERSVSENGTRRSMFASSNNNIRNSHGREQGIEGVSRSLSHPTS
ncbi:hypothetical protein ACFE04_020860 [Oxalis oulophora]